MHRFTSEFGMGSGGSNALWSPGKLACRRWSHIPGDCLVSTNRVVDQAVCPVFLSCYYTGLVTTSAVFSLSALHPNQQRRLRVRCLMQPIANNLDYMVKPHGQLVLVSSTPHNAYTPSLSTSWSWTALQGT